MPKRLQTHHQRTRPQPHAEDRPSPSRRGYDRRWLRLRKWVLAHNPFCVHCDAAGRSTLATEVDHIVPIRRGGARLDPANLQPLCKSCHSRKTARETFGQGELQGGGGDQKLTSGGVRSASPPIHARSRVLNQKAQRGDDPHGTPRPAPNAD